MTSLLIPVVLSGGNGSRLWPLSREEFPKQFLRLTGESSLLQGTMSRLSSLDCHKPLVISNELHRFIVAEQLREIGQLDNNIILEPVGKNTAPAVCLAALISLKKNPDNDPLLLVLASDHSIENEKAFCEALKNSIPLAESGNMVTFGITPTHPETGYGYIHKGNAIDLSNSLEIHKVESFTEKPNLADATRYTQSGEYVWNSGIFLFSAKKYLDELRQFRPDILKICQDTIDSIHEDLDFIRLDPELFNKCPDESIDYAVMEHTKDAVVVSLDIGWSDIGAWSSLWDISVKDSFGNVQNGDILSIKTSNSYIYSESCLVTTLGVNDLIIVQTKDALLVANRNDVQDLRTIVKKIKDSGRHEHRIHREIFRPWGRYDSIDSGKRYQVKRITVNPGEALSLQMHHHRAEHWIVVAGTAKVILNDQVKLLVENESIYIPVGAKHCLENPGMIPLELIEVRSGTYLEEDDIIRFSDKYGRV